MQWGKSKYDQINNHNNSELIKFFIRKSKNLI